MSIAMISYQYQVIRYCHNQLSEEFVNVGIILFASQTHTLKALVTNTHQRVSEFFNYLQPSSFIARLKQLEKEIITLSHNQEQMCHFTSIQEVTFSILPEDDTALFFSEIKTGIDSDLKTAIQDLYEQFIGRYEEAYSPSREMVHNNHLKIASREVERMPDWMKETVQSRASQNPPKRQKGFRI